MTGSATSSGGVGRSLRHIGRLALAHRGVVALVFVSMVIEVAYETYLSLSLKYLIDDALAPRDVTVLILISGALVAGFVVATAARILRDYLYARLGAEVLNEIRLALFAKLQQLSLRFYGRTQTGDLLSRFTTDLSAVENAIILGFPTALLSGLYILVTVATLLFINWPLGLAAAIGLPLSLLATRFTAPRAIAAGYALRVRQASLARDLQENLTTQPVIKAFNWRDSAIAHFRERAT